MKNSALFLPCRAAFSFVAALTLIACTADTEKLCTGGRVEKDKVCVCPAGQQFSAKEKICQVDARFLPKMRSNIVDGGGDTGAGLAMVLDADNYPHLAYFETINADLRYASLSPESGKWVTENIDVDGDVGQYPSIAVVNGKSGAMPVVVYYDNTLHMLKGAIRRNAEWSQRVLDPAEGTVLNDLGRHASVAVSNTGGELIAHIAYIDSTASDLYYLRWDLEHDADVPAPVLVDSGITNIGGVQYGSGQIDGGTSIAVDSNGSPLISYRDSKTADLKVAVYNQAEDTWDVAFVDNDPETSLNFEDMGEFSSLAVDRLNNFHVAYYDRTNEALRYGIFDGSDWVLETVDRGMVGAFASLAVNASDRSPFIAYFDAAHGTAKLAHRRKDGVWQIETVATLGASGFYIRLGLTGKAIPAIAYRELYSRTVYFDYVLTYFAP